MVGSLSKPPVGDGAIVHATQRAASGDPPGAVSFGVLLGRYSLSVREALSSLVWVTRFRAAVNLLKALLLARPWGFFRTDALWLRTPSMKSRRGAVLPSPWRQ